MKKLLLAILLAASPAVNAHGFVWKYGLGGYAHPYVGNGYVLTCCGANQGNYLLLTAPSIAGGAYRSIDAQVTAYNVGGSYSLYMYSDPGNVYRDTTEVVEGSTVYGLSGPQGHLQTGSFTGATSYRIYIHVINGSIKLRDLTFTEDF